MSDADDFEIPENSRPDPKQVTFDLDAALSSVVALRATVANDAFTARTLGTERSGHGVLIGSDGLVLTIGYLVIEAEAVWLVGGAGRAVPAHVMAYDQETGFGLVQALENLDAPVMALGSSADLAEGEQVIVAGQGGRRHAIDARVVAKREFAGYWEYLLNEAIFTAPPHPSWGGAALIGGDGTLRGIGSLFVQEDGGAGASVNGNMIVPIDILKPILDDMVTRGGSPRPARPWLGMMTAEAENVLMVAGLSDGGPAEAAGVAVGDRILEVDGVEVGRLGEMFRRTWALGDAGVEVPLTVLRDGDAMEVRVRSAARVDFLKTPRLH